MPFRLVEGIDPDHRSTWDQSAEGRKVYEKRRRLHRMLGREYREASPSRGHHACEAALIDLLLGLLGPPLRKPLREPLAVDLGLDGDGAEELLKVLRLDLLLGFISFAIFTIFWKSASGDLLWPPESNTASH